MRVSFATCRSSWQETKSNGRLQPKLSCNFFQRSTEEITFCTLCFTELDKVFHIFHPFAECDVFGVRQNDRHLRSVILDDLWVKIRFHGLISDKLRADAGFGKRQFYQIPFQKELGNCQLAIDSWVEIRSAA